MDPLDVEITFLNNLLYETLKSSITTKIKLIDYSPMIRSCYPITKTYFENLDFEFYNKMSTTEQKKIIKELREINKITRVEKPYRLTLLESDMRELLPVTARRATRT